MVPSFDSAQDIGEGIGNFINDLISVCQDNISLCVEIYKLL